MKINHVAIYVNNLEKTKEFYVKYFQAKANEKRLRFKGWETLESYFSPNQLFSKRLKDGL